MSATALGAIVAIVVGYAAGIVAIVQLLARRLDRIEDRLERIEDRLTRIEVAQATYAQKLEDHIANHPGPGVQLAKP
jgi:hypothetical protein